MLAGYTLGFSFHIKRAFFSWNLNGHWVPNFSISFVGPSPLPSILLLLYSFSVPTHIVAFLRVFYLGRYPCGISKKANPRGQFS